MPPKDVIFPLGPQFYFEPSRPLDDLLHDMHVAKRLGFNSLRFQEHWCLDERVEGHIDLSKIETLLEEAERLGLYVHFCVTMEQAPAWLWRKYPDCRMVYSTGDRHEDPTQYRLPYDGKPGPCWDHPGARAAAIRFIAKLAQRLGRYDNILEWNINQEIGFWPLHPSMMRPSTLGFCYCPYTLASFRDWLKKKYGDLDALNRAWRTGYGDWEEVEPPRLFDRVPSYIDWRYFMDDVYVPRHLRWKAETFRANDPKRRPIFAHIGGVTPGRGCDWRWAKEVEVFGSSCYPTGVFHEWDAGYPAPGRPVSREECIRQEVLLITLMYDYVRCAAGPKRRVAAAEFQGGPKRWLGRVPSPDDIRRWVLAALSSGIQELYFWNLRSEIFWDEAYGFGLLDSRGDSTARAREAGRLAKSINRHAELFHSGRVPKADVAILINEDLWHFMQARGVHQENLDSHLSYTIRGIYKMLWDAGVWIDFVEAKEITLESLNGYKLIIMPFPLAMDDDVFDLLKNYVSSGGVLLSEACPGRHDRFGFARPGELAPSAEELFGVEHRSVQLCHEPRQPPRWTPLELSYGQIRPAVRFRGVGSFTGHSVLPSLCIETFTVKDSTPILLCKDQITGVVNDFGRGKAYLIGTLLGHAYTAFNDVATQEFLLALLNTAGIKRELCGRLPHRRRINGECEAWFLFNMTSQNITQHVNVKGFSRVEDLLGGTMNIKSGTIKIGMNPYEIRCLIMER